MCQPFSLNQFSSGYENHLSFSRDELDRLFLGARHSGAYRLTIGATVDGAGVTGSHSQGNMLDCFAWQIDRPGVCVVAGRSNVICFPEAYSGHYNAHPASQQGDDELMHFDVAFEILNVCYSHTRTSQDIQLLPFDLQRWGVQDDC